MSISVIDGRVGNVNLRKANGSGREFTSIQVALNQYVSSSLVTYWFDCNIPGIIPLQKGDSVRVTGFITKGNKDNYYRMDVKRIEKMPSQIFVDWTKSNVVDVTSVNAFDFEPIQDIPEENVVETEKKRVPVDSLGRPLFVYEDGKRYYTNPTTGKKILMTEDSPNSKIPTTPSKDID